MKEAVKMILSAVVPALLIVVAFVATMHIMSTNSKFWLKIRKSRSKKIEVLQNTL